MKSERYLLRNLVSHQPGMDPVVDATFRVTHPILEPAACLNWANREVCSWQKEWQEQRA